MTYTVMNMAKLSQIIVIDWKSVYKKFFKVSNFIFQLKGHKLYEYKKCQETLELPADQSLQASRVPKPSAPEHTQIFYSIQPFKWL